MRQIQRKGILAISLLAEEQWTLDELADKLSVCRRYAQSILRYLKDSGYSINSRLKGRIKYFWIAQSPDLLPAILTPSEKKALDMALAAPNYHLKAAVFKLTQFANVQIYFHLHK